MMPELTLEDQADLLHRLGFDGMELRVRQLPEDQRGGGYSFWGEHKNDVTPESIADMAEHIKKVTGDRGLAIPCLASYATADNVEEARLVAAGARACGVPMFRLACPRGYDGTVDYNTLYDEAVAAFDRALEAISEFGIKAVLECHGHTINTSASLAHRIVSHWDPERIGVIFDPNNMVRDGYETTEAAIELLGPYLAHVHIGGHSPVKQGKDDIGTTQWIWDNCSLADGFYDCPRLLRKLKAVGYGGFISVEDYRKRSTELTLSEELAYLKRVEASVS